MNWNTSLMLGIYLLLPMAMPKDRVTNFYSLMNAYIDILQYALKGLFTLYM